MRGTMQSLLCSLLPHAVFSFLCFNSFVGLVNMAAINIFSSTLLIVSYGLTLFHPVRATLDSGSCAFPNGQQATGYVVCNPTASQTSCCLEGEACLQNGLCYGAIGFMYRGACAGFVLDRLTVG